MKTVAEPPVTIELPPELKGQRVRKDVAMLALTPKNMNLTVTARKVYTVLLYLAQRSTKDEEGGYTAPLSAVLRGTGTHVKLAAVVLDYLQQMTSTNVIFRPMSESEQYMLLPDAEPTSANPNDIEDVRTFSLLAEARVSKRGGDNWITWWYPPTIEQQVIDPSRWAVIELDVLANLSTYTAVALYEIVARYRDAPGQLTPKRAADFWVPILRGNSASKEREWRKFKAEFVIPAIAQINEVSDLRIEVIEHKYGGRKVVDVQFSVIKKPRVATNEGASIDVSLVLKATALGIKEPDLDAMLTTFGEVRVANALLVLEARAGNRAMDPVGRPSSYLRRILESGVSPIESAALCASEPPAASKGAAIPVNSAERKHELTRLHEQQRIDRAVLRFAALDETERALWMDRLADGLDRSAAYARVIRRLRERDWKSPIVLAMLMRHYGVHALKEDWSEPNELQLMELKAELDQKA